MKKTLLSMLCLMLTTTILFGQSCPTFTCTTTVQLPITNFNDYNNGQGIYQNLGVNRCIQGTGTIANNINEIVGWSKWSFNAIGGNIMVSQTINLSEGKKLYITGNVTVSQLSTAGGSDSAIIYVSDNSNLIINNASAPNNTNNYVMLGFGATVKIAGTFYTVGQYYQHSGNSTNVINIIGCNGGVPLPIHIQYFTKTGDMINWKVNLDNNFQRIKLEYSTDGKTWETKSTTFPTDDKISEGRYITTTAGQYRLNVDGLYSNIIYIENKGVNVKKDIRISDYVGRLYSTDPKGIIYYKDGKGYFIQK